MKYETLLIPVEDGIAQNVGREQIAGKLDSLKAESERARQRLRKSCFADTRNIFNQQMTARQQASNREFHRISFPDDHFTNLFCECIDLLPHIATIYRIGLMSKHGRSTENFPLSVEA